MNVLLLTPMLPQAQAPGAIPVLLHALVSSLAQHHRVTLVTPVGSEGGEQEALDAVRKLGVTVYPAPLMPPGAWPRWERRLRLGGTWLAGRSPWRTCWFFSPQIQHILDDLLRRDRFDVVQVEDNAMGVYRLRTHAPKLLTEHEVRRPRSVQWQRPPAAGWRQWVLGEMDWQRWRGYQRRTWEKFDRIQVFTQRDAETLQEMAPGLGAWVRVNPFGVTPPDPVDIAREKPDRLLFTGNFTHAPNVDAALWLGQEIMPHLRRLRPGVHLSLVGIYPPDAVKALACADIEVTGPVPEIEPWLEWASVVMAPLRIGGGMRMKVLHAMAVGKAVVTTSRGAEGLAIDGCEPPLEVADGAQTIAAATAALLADPQRRRLLGAQARAFVLEHFSPEAYLHRLEAVYAELLTSRNGQGSERQIVQGQARP